MFLCMFTLPCGSHHENFTPLHSSSPKLQHAKAWCEACDVCVKSFIVDEGVLIKIESSKKWRTKSRHLERPGLNHICVQLGPTPPSLLGLLPAPAWELFLVGNQCDNTWLNDQALNGLSDRVLSHWFPTRKSSHAGAGRKTRQWRRHGRGGVQLNTYVI